LQTETAPVFAGFEGRNTGLFGKRNFILRSSLALKYQWVQIVRSRRRLWSFQVQIPSGTPNHSYSLRVSDWQGLLRFEECDSRLIKLFPLRRLLEMTIDLSTAKLKERIIKYLQTRYRKTGVNTPISWRAIWIELGATEENFSKALQAAADADGGADVVFVDRERIKLGPKWT
jgi:hypothetical protein